MAFKSSKPIGLLLELVSMGLSVKYAADLLKFHFQGVWDASMKHPTFRAQLDQAMADRQVCLAISPLYWVCPRTFEIILDHNFDPIPRRDIRTLKPWIDAQVRPLLLKS